MNVLTLAPVEGPTAWVIVAIGLGLGLALCFAAAAAERRAWIAARAPRLPIRLLAVHDDAWLRGRATTASPLTCPWFGVECIAFAYRKERKTTRTVRDKDGRTRTEESWSVVASESETAPFTLVEADQRIVVQAPEGEIEAWESLGTEYEGASLRHEARILRVDAEVSVLGVKRDDGTFGPLREVPLLVTHAEHHEYTRGRERAGVWLRRGGLLLVLLGSGTGSGFLAGEPGREFALPVALGVGLGALVLAWTWATFNRLVRARNAVRAAWRQIDVDAAVRAQLVPNLVEVVKAYGAHERGLLERIAGLRSGSVAAESDAARTVRAVIALQERYPELAASGLHRDLHDRLVALEEKLATSRELYNRMTKAWNDLVQQMPSGIVARLAGHRPAEFFAADTVAPPRVDLSQA
ncbi:MAG: LemA family protein [Planctomycetes bacterium]|nr:LemA family protein [Planctomycetota bacterium]